METKRHKLCCLGVGLIGLAVWTSMSMVLNKKGAFDYQPNVACIKGSPFGKVVALAVQGPIDFYWHGGETHEDMEVISSHVGEGRECGSCAGCEGCGDATISSKDHTHHGHNHVHSEGCQHGHEHGEHAQHDFTLKEKETHEPSKKPFHVAARERIKLLKAYTHRGVDNKPLSAAHQKYLQEVTEDKLRFAYELDPSNYTNYGNYHLFVATTTYGRHDANDDKALRLAKQTLKYCKKDQVDPATWLTAASAAYNVMYHIGRYHEEYTIPEAKASIAEFDACMRKFNTLLDSAVEEGRYASMTKLKEMHARAEYLKKLRYAQGQFMKRQMLGAQASNVTQSSR